MESTSIFICRPIAVVAIPYTVFLLCMTGSDDSIFGSITSIAIFTTIHAMFDDKPRCSSMAPIIAILSNIAHVILTILVNNKSLDVKLIFLSFTF